MKSPDSLQAAAKKQLGSDPEVSLQGAAETLGGVKRRGECLADSILCCFSG
jgi:hypothetical protein